MEELFPTFVLPEDWWSCECSAARLGTTERPPHCAAPLPAPPSPRPPPPGLLEMPLPIKAALGKEVERSGRPAGVVFAEARAHGGDDA